MLKAVVWFRSTWQDDRLTWNPKDYHGISEMRIPASELWVPDLEIYNAEDYGQGYFSHDFLRQRNHYAIVYNTSLVLCIPPTEIKVRCDEQEYADYPWGEYSCRYLQIFCCPFPNLTNLNMYIVKKFKKLLCNLL